MSAQTRGWQQLFLGTDNVGTKMKVARSGNGLVATWRQNRLGWECWLVDTRANAVTYGAGMSQAKAFEAARERRSDGLLDVPAEDAADALASAEAVR